MGADHDLEPVFDTEAELRALEADLDNERTELYEELTAAFRRLNEENLHDAAERTYPLTQPEKRAVRRETTGPVRLLPEWEERYRAVADDQRTARERLASFHRDVFTDFADGAAYTLTVEDHSTKLDRPYLDVWARGDESVVVLELDNPVTEGYAYRTTDEYTEQDVQNALQLLDSIEELDVDRFGFLIHDTALVDDDAIQVDTDDPDPDALRSRVQVEILDALDTVDYEHVETEDSPVLAFLETIAAYGLTD